MSPVRPYNDPAEDAAAVARSRQAWDRILAARQQVTRADAQAVTTMAANYPHMSPGTVVPLARQGITPDDPLAQHVALQEAKSNKRKRGFWGAVGDWANPVNFIGNVGEFAVSNVLNPIGGAALGATKQVLRPGLAALAAPFEVGTGIYRNIAAATGEIGAGAASGAAIGAAAGVAPAGPTAGLSVLAGAGIGAVVGGIGGAIAHMRGARVESEGFVNPLSQSTLFQSLGEKGLGSGYLPMGTAHEAATDAARRAASISGHALTPGRFLATAVVEPGTAPYNLLSGAMDATVAWELDPTAVGLKGVNKWRKAARTFTASEKEIAAAARAGGGVVPEAARAAEETLPAGSRVRPEPLPDSYQRYGYGNVRMMEPGAVGKVLGEQNDIPIAELRARAVESMGGHVEGGELRESIDRLKAQIAKDGRIKEPIEIDPTTNRIVDGHTRAVAAYELGLPIPVRETIVDAANEGAPFVVRYGEEAARAFERAEAGLVEGARKTIIGEKVDAWLGTAKGQKAMQWFADMGFEDIRRQLGPNVELNTVKDLADAKTVEEVDAILRPRLGIARGLEHKPTVGGFGMEVKRLSSKLPMYDKVKESRLWSDLPTGHVDYSDPTQATDQFNLLLRDANRHLDPDFDIDGITEQFGRLMLEGTYESRRQADFLAYKAFGGAQGKVAQSEAGRAFMNKLAKRAAETDDKVMRSLIDEDVTKMPLTNASVNGQTLNLPSSGLLIDHFDRGFDIDRSTIRGIRAATSKYARLVNHPLAQNSVSFMSGATDNVWKPAALLRGAWTVRVVGEEQIRMAAAGRLSLFNHPLSYLAWAMDDEGRIATIFKKHGIEIGGRGGVDITGEEFARRGSTIEPANTELERELLDGADEFATAANYRQQAQGWQGKDFTAAGHTFNYSKGMPGHVEATAEKIDQLHGDPILQMLASEPRPVVREWLINGEGKAYRDAVNAQGGKLRSYAEIDAHLDNAQKHLNAVMGRVEEARPGLGALPGVGDRGPSFAPAHGPHPGIGAGAPGPEAVGPLQRPGYQPPGPGYAPPTGAARPTLSPAERARAEQVAARERELAQQGRTAEMNERLRAEQAGGRTTPTPTYGNAATQTAPRIEGPQVSAGRPGSPAIREAIATGEINGIPIRLPNGKPNPEFISELRKIENELPDQITASAAHMPNKRFDAKRDAAVQTMFTNMMTRPSAKLSRSPMFRQTYWEEAENVITEMDTASQARLLENARKAKLDNAAIKRLELRAKASSGDLTLNEADLLLKGRGLDRTQELLYDAAKRGQMSDVMRIIMPFAEAQKEVMTTWAKLGLIDNAAVVRRAQQVLSGARGGGYFYKDPSTGQEMFVMPGSEFVTDKLLGMPIPLTGSVAGLNTFGQGIIPGIGPAAQIPAGYLLADKPQFENLMKFVDPFGASNEDSGMLEKMAPAWFKKTMTAFSKDPESDRVFANTVKDVWAMGISSGQYSAETPEDIRNGLDDAKFRARGLYFLRGMASVTGVAPTGLSPEMQAMDKDGKWVVADKLKDDLQKMLKEDPESANQKFLEKYGNNAFAFLQGKSYSTAAASPTSVEAGDWLKKHPGLVERYGDVVGLFAPQGEEFDYQQYLKNLKSGVTKSLTPEEYAEAANDKLGKMVYYNAKDRFGPRPSKEQREWLSDLRDLLREEFPGFDKHLPGKPDQQTVTREFIPQIVEAINDPKLANNDIAKATKLYLKARQTATSQAKAAGYESFTQAKGAEPLRQWLRQLGDLLIEEVPDFEPMFSTIFDREMVDDEQPVTVPA